MSEVARRLKSAKSADLARQAHAALCKRRWRIGEDGSILGKVQSLSLFEFTMEDKSETALEFLEALDSRHNEVLDELDALNARIEAVLGQFSTHRNTPNETTVSEVDA